MEARGQNMLKTFRTKLRLIVALTYLVLLGLSIGLLSIVVRDYDFQSPIVITRQPVMVRKPEAKPVVLLPSGFASAQEIKDPRDLPIKDNDCEWSKECVESYIRYIFRDDSEGMKWALFTSENEGGYRSQWSQHNPTDLHSSGKVGSFGQFQFGEDTYNDHCEPNVNWKMSWKSQVRCARVIWDKGIAHNTWYLTTNKYLSTYGLLSL